MNSFFLSWEILYSSEIVGKLNPKIRSHLVNYTETNQAKAAHFNDVQYAKSRVDRFSHIGDGARLESVVMVRDSRRFGGPIHRARALHVTGVSVPGRRCGFSRSTVVLRLRMSTIRMNFHLESFHFETKMMLEKFFTENL